MSESYNGVQKAAILLIALGPEKAATIFKHLKEDEIEELTLEIANTRSVSPQTKEDVLMEFYQICLAQQYIAEGGIGYAKELLEKALGADRAQGVISKLTASLQVRPFEFVRKTDPSQLLNFIQDEHPQTIAMILSYLAPGQSALVLGALPPEKQADVAKRIAMMDRTSPDVIKEVERVLERKLASLVNQDYTIVGGIDSIVSILNSVDRGTEKHIMESLEIEEPELADEIRKKMFVFEDILLLDDRAIQRVLREVDNADLELALKSTTEEVQNVIFKNLSKRLAAMIKEDMDFMGPVRMKDVEEAQQKIVGIILLCFGLLVLLLLTVLGGVLSGLLFSSPFILCGMVCLVFKRNAGLWCAWALLFAVNVYLRYATGITLRLTRWTLNYDPSMNYMRLAFAWIELICYVAIIVVTVMRFRKKPLVPTKKTYTLLAVGCIAFALTYIPVTLGPLSAIARVHYIFTDWIRLALLVPILTAVARLFYHRKCVMQKN